MAETVWVATKAERGAMVSKDAAAMRLQAMEAIVGRRLTVNADSCRWPVWVNDELISVKSVKSVKDVKCQKRTLSLYI